MSSKEQVRATSAVLTVRGTSKEQVRATSAVLTVVVSFNINHHIIIFIALS